MARIDNPFKERRDLWARYGALCIFVAICCFFFINASWTTTTITSTTTGQGSGVGTSTGSQELLRNTNDWDGKTKRAAKIERKLEKKDEEDEEDEDEEEEEEEEEDFPKVSLSDYPSWLHGYYKKRKWKEVSSSFFSSSSSMKKNGRYKRRLNASILEESLLLGCRNIAENQRGEGNFNYQYNFVTKEMDDDDSQVRQAGALWGVTLCFQNQPGNLQFQQAAERGINFFVQNSIEIPGGGNDDHNRDENNATTTTTTTTPTTTLFVKYPSDPVSETGTNGLFGLALVDYLRTIEDDQRRGQSNDEDGGIVQVSEAYKDRVERTLRGLINHFLSLRLKNSPHFSGGVNVEAPHRKKSGFSPYSDGEVMLCLIKAAKYLNGYDHLIPIIEQMFIPMTKSFTVDAWRQDEHDSDQTKGFYQWSSMVAWEYYSAKMDRWEVVGDYVVSLAHWIIHTHSILTRVKNTGYAFEGIISAYLVAKERGHDAAVSDMVRTIDVGLRKLTTWQVGGPLSSENAFLRKNPTEEAIAVGGIMSDAKHAPLRIDTTQHQMHALMMAIESLYSEQERR